MKVVSRSIAVMAVVAAVLIALVLPASAQTLSNGCAIVQAGLGFPAGASWQLTGFTFYAGETITFNVADGGTHSIQVPTGTTVASGPGLVSYTFPADFTGNMIFLAPSASGLIYQTSCFVGGLPAATDGEEGPRAGIPCIAAFDGRINNVPELDCAPPAAIYDEGDYFALYGIDPTNGAGELVFRVQKADIGDTPAANTLLAEGFNVFTGQPVSVWHLSSGELQVNATYSDGKPFIFTFSSDGILISHAAA